MNNQGYDEEKAKRLEEAYHNLYKVYFAKLKQITDQAAIDGFVTVAYGLRIDAPAIAKSVLGTKVTPATVEAEVRSLSNAICQSYGQMNTFAADDFMRRVWDSKWKYDIKIQALIHDAIYLFAPQDLECIEWVNQNLIECMCMQMEDNIKGSDVKLEANLDVHYPTWAQALELPNNASVDTIKTEVTNFILKQQEK
jgi:DNA polymerase-1